MNNIKQIDTISNRMKIAMKIRGMKAQDIANKTGINKVSISQYLSEAYEPKTDRIYLIAKALSVDPVWLSGLDVPMEKPSAMKEAETDVKLITAYHNAPKSVQDGIMALLQPYM